MTPLSHMEALNTRLAAEQPVVPLRLPVTADEWTVHAPTTIRDAAGEVLAECSGHGRHSVEDEAIAAEIVRRVNAHGALMTALLPFARWASGFGDHGREDSWVIAKTPAGKTLTMGDVRRAHALFEKLSDGGSV